LCDDFFELPSFFVERSVANLFLPRDMQTVDAAGTQAIVVRDLKKSYGSVAAVSGISFSVARGETVGLLGGNGAGKTTTLSMLLGVLTPSGGSIELLGLSLAAHRYEILPRINFTSPYVDLPKRLSVVENLRVFAGLYGVRDGKKRIAELLGELDLDEVADRPYANLSAGQRTRVSLAKSLLNSPELLLLDEPTASLDPDVGDRMRSLLERYRQQSGCAMLLASHNMAEVERLCDDVIMLKRGEIVDKGSPAGLLSKYGRTNLDDVFLDISRSESVEVAT
jgi:ABC-2 type transport system ATP-binding protein